MLLFDANVQGNVCYYSENTLLHVTYIWHCNEGALYKEGTVAPEMCSNHGGRIKYVIVHTAISIVVAVAILTTAATAHSL